MKIKDNNNLVVDGIELDKTNTLFFNAAKLVLETEQKIIYLTGKAGTGKTTFLKYIRSVFKGNMVVLAPTGVAAVNARGQTIHSFFQIKPSVYVPNDMRLRKKANLYEEDKSTIYDHFKYSPERLNIIRGLELMIIDEISMVRCDLLDVIDRLLRIYRKKESVPFGGVQVILIGDTFQLPPVAPSNEWEILKNFYDSRFFFSSKVIKDNKPIYIELKKIYRQKEEEFIDLLNRVRVNQVGQNELNILNSRYNPKFTPDINSNYITLATHNRIADGINQKRLDELQTELKLFEATLSGTFDNQDIPTDRVLHLKEGAQIMFVKNDSGKKYCNGTIAKITKIEEYNIIVEFENKQEITVEKQTWENITYSWNDELKKVEEKVIGSFTQFPVKLAWAITVHKSQGKTFDKVIADLGSSFDHGQVYVALSRCSTLNGIILKSRITRDNIIIDKKALEFAKTETPENMIIQEYEKGKADKLYKKCREAFDNNSSDEMLKLLNEAIKVRDDRETPKFKQYVRVKLKLFFKYKKEIEELKQEIEDLEIVNHRLGSDMWDLHYEPESELNLLYREVEDLKYENERLRKCNISAKLYFTGKSWTVSEWKQRCGSDSIDFHFTKNGKLTTICGNTFANLSTELQARVKASPENAKAIVLGALTKPQISEVDNGDGTFSYILCNNNHYLSNDFSAPQMAQESPFRRTLSVDQFKNLMGIENLRVCYKNPINPEKAGLMYDEDTNVIVGSVSNKLSCKADVKNPVVSEYIDGGWCFHNQGESILEAKGNDNLYLSNIIKEKDDLIRQLQAEKSQILQILNQSNFESDDLP